MLDARRRRLRTPMICACLLAACGGRSASAGELIGGAGFTSGDGSSAGRGGSSTDGPLPDGPYPGGSAAGGSGPIGAPTPDIDVPPGFPSGESCANGILDGDESDVDCGGATCGVCGTGARCSVDFDCGGLRCVNAACQQATCADGVQNGDELGVDCGGSCGRCPVVFEPCNCTGTERVQAIACGGIDLWTAFASSNGDTLVYQQNGETYTWTAATGPLLTHAAASVVGLSADGQTLLLNVEETGATELWRPDQPALVLPGNAPLGFSADGLSVLFYEPNARAATVWRDGTSFGVGERVGSSFDFPRALSADGSVVVGARYVYDDAGSYQLPFRWTEAGGMQVLDPLPPAASHGVAVVSNRDGSVAAGWLWAGSDDSASSLFRWTADTGSVELAPSALSAGQALLPPFLSDDGGVVVGTLGAGNRREILRPFRWTEADGVQLLGGDAAPPGIVSFASADAHIVVGSLLPDDVFVWSEGSGLRELSTALANTGENVGNWTYESGAALSADGRVLFGMGYCGSQRAAYRAVLPE